MSRSRLSRHRQLNCGAQFCPSTLIHQILTVIAVIASITVLFALAVPLAAHRITPRPPLLRSLKPPQIDVVARRAPLNLTALEPWRARSDTFVNIFLVWTTPRDTWGAVQDRVLGSVVARIPGARVRVISNTLPLFHFDALFDEGFDVGVVRYNVIELLDGLPGARWARAATRAASPYQATHESDLVRLLALARFGG